MVDQLRKQIDYEFKRNLETSSFTIFCKVRLYYEKVIDYLIKKIVFLAKAQVDQKALICQGRNSDKKN